MADAVNLTATTETPKAFTDAFNEIKAAAATDAATETPVEAPKRGRPRKVKDELDTSVKDEAGAMVDTAPVKEPVPDVDDDEQPQKQSADAESYIPDEWVNAGRKAGMSDTTIQTLAAESPDVLKRLTGKAEPPAQSRREPAPRRVQDDPILKLLDERLDPAEHGEALAKKFDVLSAALKEERVRRITIEQNMAERDENSAIDRFDAMLDKASADVPSVGTTEKAVKGSKEHSVRQDIYTKAVTLRRGNPGLSFDESVKGALNWHLGEHGASAIKKDLITKIKAQAGKLTYRPTHRIAAETESLTGDERGIANVEKVMQRLKNA